MKRLRTLRVGDRVVFAGKERNLFGTIKEKEWGIPAAGYRFMQYLIVWEVDNTTSWHLRHEIDWASSRPLVAHKLAA